MFSPHEFDYAASTLSLQSQAQAYLNPQPTAMDATEEGTYAPPASPAVASRRAGRAGLGGGEKGAVRISMGFRADCEKCVRRVVGHYSHVVGEDGVVQVEAMGR